MTPARLFIIVSCLVIISIAAHAFIPHDHPTELYGNTVQAALHVDGREWQFILTVPLFFLLARVIREDSAQARTQPLVKYDPPDQFRLFKPDCPIEYFLRRGIMHPKLYS